MVPSRGEPVPRCALGYRAEIRRCAAALLGILRLKAIWRRCRAHGAIGLFGSQRRLVQVYSCGFSVRRCTLEGRIEMMVRDFDERDARLAAAAMQSVVKGIVALLDHCYARCFEMKISLSLHLYGPRIFRMFGSTESERGNIMCCCDLKNIAMLKLPTTKMVSVMENNIGVRICFSEINFFSGCQEEKFVSSIECQFRIDWYSRTRYLCPHSFTRHYVKYCIYQKVVHRID